jgi:hypothetical protein
VNGEGHGRAKNFSWMAGTLPAALRFHFGSWSTAALGCDSAYFNGSHRRTARAMGKPTRNRWPMGPVMIEALVQTGQR